MAGIGVTEILVVVLLILLPAAVIYAVVRLGVRGSGRSGQAPVTGVAGWHPDPTHRHEFRYWDGRAWTDRISDRGNEGVDSFDAAAPKRVL